MRRIVRVDRACFERDESVAKIAGVAQVIFEKLEQHLPRSGIGVNRVHIAAKHRDLNTLSVKRLSDFKREARIQYAGFHAETGDGLPKCQLRADQILRRDFRGKFAGRQATEIVSTDADTDR